MHTHLFRRLLTTVALGCASTLALSACGSADAGSASAAASPDAAPVVVEHVQGTTEVPVQPENVIVFDMASLDTLTELGVDVQGMPKSHLPEFLGQYEDDRYVDAGTLFEPDYEAVNAAEPDLIVVGGRSSEVYAELSEIAPTIDLTLDQADFLGSFEEATLTLGRIFDKEGEAQAALDDLQANIASVKDTAQGAGNGLIVLTSGGEVTAYGPGSRFGFLHDVLGVEPAVEDVEAATHGEAVSFEFVAETNPDWLFVVDRDVATGESTVAAEQVLDNELVAGTTAWQEEQVVYLDPIRWYIVGAGLGTLNAMTDHIGESLS